MTVICVDDERLQVEYVAELCLSLDNVDEAKGFTKPFEVLEYLEQEPADLALLDIDMPGMNGIELAEAIRERHPYLPIIFLTGYPQYTMDALQVHASGYLLKPVKKEKLATEVAYAIGSVRRKQPEHIEAHTFGNFDLFVNRKPIAFRREKCKELLAYLIDRHGAGVTRREAFAVLWEDRLYDRPMQKQLDTIIRDLRATLADNDADEILEIQSGTIRVNPDLISCDAWQYLAGRREAIRAFRGEYMSNYSWADLNGGLTPRQRITDESEEST